MCRKPGRMGVEGIGGWDQGSGSLTISLLRSIVTQKFAIHYFGEVRFTTDLVENEVSELGPRKLLSLVNSSHK